MSAPLVEVHGLKVHFPVKAPGLFGRARGVVRAVDDVSFEVRRGETVGLVGESGSGKTTIGRAILRAVEPTAGTIALHVDGERIDLATLTGEALRRLRPRMSLVFQDPYGALNPRMTVRDIIAEPLVAAGQITRRGDVDARVRQIAERCKLDLEHLRRFPHAFSGGQRQRISIARALVCAPDFVVCDESVSALDVSIQAGIVNLLKDLQDELGVAFLFIAHDLSVVAQISHRVAVLYLGRFMEYAPTKSVFFAPKHPYTHALLCAVPTADPDARFDPVALDGEIPSPLNLPPGCRFASRCPYADARCRTEVPAWREINPQHFIACHRAEELDLPVRGRAG
ncbi:MAG: oligopeptide/dipeptide ABC transporter ATP-binding protein [Pseudomonadota bacterium]